MQRHRIIMDNPPSSSPSGRAPAGEPVLTEAQLAKLALRKDLLAKRLAMPDREWHSEMLQRVMRVWLIERPDTVIGAYWPIKGEFDPLPALHRWKEDGELLDEPQLRRIGLPVVNKQHKTLTFAPWKKMPTAFPNPKTPS
jgi:5-formyltetrahydrofolate cyclo-ligase